MSFRLCHIILLVFLLLPGYGYSLDRPLKLRGSDYPPYIFKSEHEIWTGIEYQIAEKVITIAGYEYEIVEAPWKRSLFLMRDGELDIMVSLLKTSEREEYMDFIGVTRLEQVSLVVDTSKGDFIFNKRSDLEEFIKGEHLVGIQVGAHFAGLSDWLEENPELFERLHNAPDEDQLMKMIQLGRILAFFEDKTYAHYRIKNYKGAKPLTVEPLPFKPKEVYLVVSKKLPQADRDALRAAYNKLVESGELVDILNAWGPPTDLP